MFLNRTFWALALASDKEIPNKDVRKSNNLMYYVHVPSKIHLLNYLKYINHSCVIIIKLQDGFSLEKCRGLSRISGKGVHMYNNGVGGGSLCWFYLIFLKYSRPKYFIFIGSLKTGAERGGGSPPLDLPLKYSQKPRVLGTFCTKTPLLSHII